MADYLDGVSHDVIRDFELSPDRVLYRRVPGESTPDPPGDQSFWVAQVTAEQADELTWEVDSGDWTVVLMNADGSRGVDLDARLGIKVDWLLPALIGLLALGLVLLAGGAALVIVGSRGQAQPAAPQPAEALPAEPATWPAPAPPGAAPTPAVAARHGGAVSARPHRPARPFAQPRVVARQVAARHPPLHRARLPVDRLRHRDGDRLLRHRVHRPLPAGAVRLQRRRAAVELAGRLLLLQRAGHRPLPALQSATGRLPGRALRPVSRNSSAAGWCSSSGGSWRLPQYVVVGIFGGGWWLGWWEPTDARWAGDRPGLIGVLVLFAAVVVLFTGRYPATIFNFVMGLNRWVYRVVAYATLMTDEYPPFRFDQGGDETTTPNDPVARQPDR